MDPNKQIPVVMNPAANSARAAGQLERVSKLSPRLKVLVTDGIGSARRLAMELAEQGYELVVAAGGDGTVNEVINGLMTSYAQDPANRQLVKLGILPMGTMNVLAYELGLPKRDVEGCWELIEAGRTRKVDLWKANGEYFVQLAGVGLDAQIVQQTPWELKKRFGPLSYVMGAARVLGQEAPLLGVEIEGRPALYGSVVLIGNGKHYGGPVPVFRHADPEDGLLDVLIFRKRRALEIFQFLSGLVAGGYEACEDLDYVQAREIRVFSVDGSAVPYELDGELSKMIPVKFEPAEFALDVVI